MIDQTLQGKLIHCKNLPSPPGIATEIIALANDPEANMERIAEVLSIDPATTAKILRIANSPMYGFSRKSENLRQALLVLGLNATIALALSFSLVKSLRATGNRAGLDYTKFWRRALLSATATRALSNVAGIKESEELFLASLMQDIGVLALDQALPDLYAHVGDRQASEQALSEYERKAIGADHADVGGWLLERWSFPSRLYEAVALSHRSESVPMTDTRGLFIRCVALASRIAEVFLAGGGEEQVESLAEFARELVGIEREGLGELMEQVRRIIPDAESVFEVEILSAADADATLAEARETLMMRNLMMLKKVDALEGRTRELTSRTRKLEEASRRDPLTGLFNRTYLDAFLVEAFERSNMTGTPLSVAFADLDRFKWINDNHGHGAGDAVLIATANILRANVRGADMIARYGGEEFVLVFPDTDYILVRSICERIVSAVQSARHDIAGSVDSLPVTISIGMATHNDGRVFEHESDLIAAADKALYSAKLQGRNRSIPFEMVAEDTAGAV